MARADLDAEEVAEPLGRGHQEPVAALNHFAHVIGQAAIGERDVAAALENEDFSLFVHAAEPGRARSAASHPADNQHSF